jgi:hypothetical protein
MTADELLAEQRARGVTPAQQGDRPRIRAARGSLTPQLRAAYLAPRTPTEQRIPAVWQDVLGRIEATLGLRLNPRVLMLDTLEQIAAGCDRRRDAATGAGARNAQPLASTA